MSTESEKAEGRRKIPGTKHYVRNVKFNKRERLYKGKSFIHMPKEYCCIDIETTGYMPDFDEVIEFCGIKIRDGKIVDTYSTLIKPKNPVDDFIEEHTGITNEMLLNQPSIEEVANEIFEYVQGETLLGQNVNFDINFLYDIFENELKKPLTNDFVDLLRLTRRLFKDFQNHKLDTIAEQLGVTPETRHRAKADCVTTIECFEICREHIMNNNINIDMLLSQATRSYSNVKLKAAQIISQNTEFDYDHPLYGKVCVFTGALEKMLRKEAMQCVVDLGGHCRDSVAKDVDYLILGNNDYCKTIKDGKSNKHKKAEKMIINGCDMKIIPEDVFYDLLLVE